MLMKKIKKNQNGFSLVELLAVVGIGGALIAGALLLVNNVNAKKDIKQHSENISVIYTNMQNLFSDESVDDNMTNLIVAGIFPSSLNINDAKTVVKTSGGGTVTIEASGADGYYLLYPKIKASACLEVLKNQKRIGWDKFGAKAGESISTTDASTDLSSAKVSNFATACNTDEDWISLAFLVE